MICAVALWCLTGTSIKRDDVTAGEVVSKMLARYSNLQSLTGQVTLVVTAEGPTGKVQRQYDTEVQYERPAKVYISQIDRSNNHQWLVTSDGNIFTHNIASDTLNSRDHRLIEQVGTNDVTMIYAACCTSLRDRSVPLGIAFSWTDELRRFINQWVNPAFFKSDQDGSGDYVIRGDHRPYATDPPSPINGTFTMHISKNFDLLEYTTSEVEAVPGRPGMTVNLTNDWKVNLLSNLKPDQSLFKAVLR